MDGWRQAAGGTKAHFHRERKRLVEVLSHARAAEMQIADGSLRQDMALVCGLRQHSRGITHLALELGRQGSPRQEPHPCEAINPLGHASPEVVEPVETWWQVFAADGAGLERVLGAAELVKASLAEEVAARELFKGSEGMVV